MSKMHNVYLLLGSNIGHSLGYINCAIEEVSLYIGKIIKKSSVYKSEPWGFDTKNYFLNQVIRVTTDLSPNLILNTIFEIENKLGRERTQNKYESRTIDIDILFYDDIIINNENLSIPHPLIAFRRFTLVPLDEIASYYKHPVTQLSIGEMLNRCNDCSEVIKYCDDSKFNCLISQDK